MMKNFIRIVLLFCLVESFAMASDERLSTIIKNNKIKVCIWTEYYGISYLDPRTQKLIGIDSDLALELAKDLKVELEYVESSFPTLIEDLIQNRCDIAMFAIGNTESRRQKVRFTTPHLSSDIYAITTKTNKKIKEWNDIDKKGVVVAVAKGTYHEPIMQEKLKFAKLLITEDFHSRGQAVISGRADVFMTDYPYVTRILSQTEWAKLIKPTTTYHKTPYAWAMAYGDDRFHERVEAFILEIKKDGRLLKIAQKNALETIVKLD